MRSFIFVRTDGPSKPQTLHEVLQHGEDALDKGDGPFQLVVDGEVIGQPKKRADMLAALERRLLLGRVGPTYRVRNTKGDVVFVVREVALKPDVINTSGNAKSDRYWSAVVEEFDWAYFLGSYVCKPDSQHRFGNAVDVGFHTVHQGEQLTRFTISRADEFDLRNYIHQTTIWHLGDSSHYSGVPHVTHGHADWDPTYDTSLPCGVRP